MSRSGFMHIVAVSGMHIAFLVGLIRLLFGSSRRSSIFCISMVWCFTLLTGAGASTVISSFMQTMLLSAPVVYRENDPITSLSAALAVILLRNPFAAASISLQLSFGAMAGIICFSGRIYGFLRRWIPAKSAFKPLDYIMATAASSIAVMVFVLPFRAATSAMCRCCPWSRILPDYGRYRSAFAAAGSPVYCPLSQLSVSRRRGCAHGLQDISCWWRDLSPAFAMRRSICRPSGHGRSSY